MSKRDIETGLMVTIIMTGQIGRKHDWYNNDTKKIRTVTKSILSWLVPIVEFPAYIWDKNTLKSRVHHSAGHHIFNNNNSNKILLS